MTALTARVLRSSSSAIAQRAVSRPALVQVQRRAYASGHDIGPGKTHATDKPGDDVQSDASRKGRAERNEQEGSNGASQATSQSDHGNHNKRAKEENPEAPGPVIGMNDERGGKGH